MPDQGELFPRRTPARWILLHYTTRDGRVQTVQRAVKFEKGFGHYVKWRKREILVEPTDVEVHYVERG